MSTDFYKLANRSISYLASECASTATALTLLTNGATSFPTSPNFPVTCEDEIMIVTGITGDTFDITRAQEGTLAATHAEGAKVSLRLTAGIIQQLQYVSSAVGKIPRIVVASVSATSIQKSQADFECDGDNDQIQIASALAVASAAGTTTVRLVGPYFNVNLGSNAITIPEGILFEGDGHNNTKIDITTSRTWGCFKPLNNSVVKGMTISGAGISTEYIMSVSSSATCKVTFDDVFIKGAGYTNWYFSCTNTFHDNNISVDIFMLNCGTENCLDTTSNNGSIRIYNANVYATNLISMNNANKSIAAYLNSVNTLTLVKPYSYKDAGFLKLMRGLASTYGLKQSGLKIDVYDPIIIKSKSLAFDGSSTDGYEVPLSIYGGIIDRSRNNALDPGGGKGWKIYGTKVLRTNFGGLWSATGIIASAVSSGNTSITINSNTGRDFPDDESFNIIVSTGAASAIYTVTSVSLDTFNLSSAVTAAYATGTTIRISSSVEGSPFTNGFECVLNGCQFEYNWRGLLLWQNNDNKIINCKISNNNHASSIYEGVLLWGYSSTGTCYNNVINGCTICDTQSTTSYPLIASASSGTKYISLATGDCANFYIGHKIRITEGANTEINYVDSLNASGFGLLKNLIYNYTTGATISGVPTQNYGIREHESSGDVDYNKYINNYFYNNISGNMLISGTHDVIAGNNPNTQDNTLIIKTDSNPAHYLDGTGGFTTPGAGIWSEATASITGVVNNAYIANATGLVTITLPATAVVGSTLEVAGWGSGLWKISQNADQYIKYLDIYSSVGILGYIKSSGQYDAVKLVCTESNNGWLVINSHGNLQVDEGGVPTYGCGDYPGNYLGEPIGGGEGCTALYTTAVATFIATSVATLTSYLALATSGQVVYIQDGTTITVTSSAQMYNPNKSCFYVPNGVILAGGRGNTGVSCGIIAVASGFKDNDWCYMIECAPNSKVVGLEIYGTQDSTATGYTWTGILCGTGTEVYNNIVHGCGYCGVDVMHDTTGVRIHHNYIHHCRGSGHGYGVELVSVKGTLGTGYAYDCAFHQASALVEGNVFDFCRHTIANQSGKSSYVYRYNYLGANASWGASQIDVHGQNDNTSGLYHTNYDTGSPDTMSLYGGKYVYCAGYNTEVYNNTTICTGGNEFAVIRGFPYEGQSVKIHNNWFKTNTSNCRVITQSMFRMYGYDRSVSLNGSGVYSIDPDPGTYGPYTTGFVQMSVYDNWYGTSTPT